MPAQDINRVEKLGYSVRGLANWILDQAKGVETPITNMALNKLLYFAYEGMLIRRNLVLTNAKIEAWEHGPVFREIYQSFKDYGDRPIAGRASFFNVETLALEVAQANLDADVAAELWTILEPYMRLSASKLREISHRTGGPWHQVWWYRGMANPGMEITPALILAGGDVAHENR